ncbi:hypothetical protein K438DRAFT_1776218 [Mycena galopus ATCC 62051]|nr:hypothetical protein K438DRAFT_1776218 [Mycena galopus ATCC 62051]
MAILASSDREAKSDKSDTRNFRLAESRNDGTSLTELDCQTERHRSKRQELVAEDRDNTRAKRGFSRSRRRESNNTKPNIHAPSPLCPTYRTAHLRVMLRVKSARLSLHSLISSKSEAAPVLAFMRYSGQFPKYDT